MSVNAKKEKYEHIELFGKPALFSNSRIDRDTVPHGFYCYDLRGSDFDPGQPVTIQEHVLVNHATTVLTPEIVHISPEKGYRRLRDGLNFLGESITLQAFCARHNIKLA